MFEYRRLELVKAGVLDADENAYEYKNAADMGLVADDEKNEVFRLTCNERC